MSPTTEVPTPARASGAGGGGRDRSGRHGAAGWAGLLLLTAVALIFRNKIQAWAKQHDPDSIHHPWKTVAVGATLGEDDPIIVLESMKMEIPVPAPAACTIVEILVAEGDTVAEGQIVAVVEI